MYRKHTFCQTASLSLFKVQLRPHKFFQLILFILQCVSTLPANPPSFVCVCSCVPIFLLFTYYGSSWGSSFIISEVCGRASDTCGMCILLKGWGCQEGFVWPEEPWQAWGVEGKGREDSPARASPCVQLCRLSPNPDAWSGGEKGWDPPTLPFPGYDPQVGFHPCGGKTTFLNSSKGSM